MAADSMYPLTTLGMASDSITAGITLGSHRIPKNRTAPYLRVANVKAGQIDLSDVQHIELDPRDRPRYELQSGDLLVVEGHANPNEIGRCAMVGTQHIGLLYQNHLFRVRMKDVESGFAELWLNSDAVRAYWRSRCATSSGLYTINSRMLAKVPFPLVPHVDQLRIVEAVTSFDQEIEAQERRIAKQLVLEQSLSEDLFTADQHTHVEDIQLSEAGQWLSGGTPNTSDPIYWGGDIPWISAASMKNFNIHDSDRRVTQIGSTSGTRLVPTGTVLFVVRGMSLNNEFRVGVTRREVAFGQDCKAILPTSSIDPVFLAYSLKAKASIVLSMVETTSHGTGRLDTARLETLTLGIPSIEEQHRVVDAIASVGHCIETMRQQIAKLRTIRKALIEDLLTGRVTVDDL